MQLARGDFKSSAGPATPCAKSPQPRFLHTHLRVRLRPGFPRQGVLLRHIFAPAAGSFWWLLGPNHVGVKLDTVGFDPLDLLAPHVLVGTGCGWGVPANVSGPCPVPDRAVQGHPEPGRCGLVPGDAAEAGRRSEWEGGFAAALSAFASSVGVNRQSWEKEEEKGSELLRSPLPSPLAAAISLRLCIGLGRMELGNTTT